MASLAFLNLFLFSVAGLLLVIGNSRLREGNRRLDEASNLLARAILIRRKR